MPLLFFITFIIDRIIFELDVIIMNKDKHSVLVDKYIYKTYNNKYRLFIRSGDYYFSSMYNTL